ncbi:MAG: FxSxx-COOH system tetratricopeptide repeat protein, partial [Chloroflexota bacterium]
MLNFNLRESQVTHCYDHLRNIYPKLTVDTTEAQFKEWASKSIQDSTLLKIWNVPYDRNINFTGREIYLRQLEKQFNDRQATTLIQTIHGLGGVGKTQIAVEYAYIHREQYQVVWWLRAEEPETLAADFADLALKLNLHLEANNNQSELISAVLQWLHVHTGWLLIFDNASHQDVLKPYLLQNGPIIITSRNHYWQNIKTLTIETMTQTEAFAFLAQATRETNKQNINALNDLLGYLPLALAQAAAYINKTGQNINGYINLFNENRQAILAEGITSDTYPNSVATTWLLSLDQIKLEQPLVLELMSLFAFFAPGNIQLSFLTKVADDLPETLARLVQDPFELDQALTLLQSYALIERSGDTINIHRLIQAVIQDRLDKQHQQKWLNTAAICLGQEASGYGDELSHLIVVVDYAERINYISEDIAQVYFRISNYLINQVQYQDAQRHAKSALTICEQLLGPNHPTTISRLSDLAGLIQIQGDYEAARPLFERALVISETALGHDHPETGTSLNNLASLFRDQGNYENAKPLFERALNISEASLGHDHPTTGSRLSNLASLLQNQGNYKAAKPLFQRALNISETSLGTDHPVTGFRLNNLASLLQDEGDYEAAKPLLERALNISEASLGHDHPTTGSRLNNLALLLQDQGSYEAAKPLFERALNISEASLGHDHPVTSTSLNNLASLLQDRGDYEAARPLFERALNISETALGTDHPETGLRLNNLALLLRDQGDYKAAKLLFERALNISET